MTTKPEPKAPEPEQTDEPKASEPKIDTAGLQAARKRPAEEALDNEREVPVWEHPDAPPGSTASSLLIYERGKAVRVQGPTHYHHLADGRVAVGYNGGTHHSEPGDDGQDKITRITAVHEG